MVGPKVANHVLETLHDAYPGPLPALGRRSRISPTAATRSRSRGDARSVDEIRDDVLAALADEIAHLLGEGVVASAAEVDACLILGAGYPFFLGGITKHLDQTGISERVTRPARSAESAR